MRTIIVGLLFSCTFFSSAQYARNYPIGNFIANVSTADLKRLSDDLEPFKNTTPEYFLFRCEYLLRNMYRMQDVDTNHWIKPVEDSLIICSSEDGTVSVIAALTDTLELYNYETDYPTTRICYSNYITEFRPLLINQALATIDSGIVRFPDYFIMWDAKVVLLTHLQSSFYYLNDFTKTRYNSLLEANLPSCVYNCMDYSEVLISLFQKHRNTSGGLILPDESGTNDSDLFLRKYILKCMNVLTMNGGVYLEERKRLALFFYDKIPDQSVILLRDAANACYYSGSYASALELFLVIRKLQPADPTVVGLIKDCYVQSKDYAGIINFLENESKGSPDNAGILYETGYYYNLTGRHDEAFYCLQKALALEPTSCVVRLELIKCYMAGSDCTNALEIYSWMMKNCSVADCLFAAGELEKCGVQPVIPGH